MNDGVGAPTLYSYSLVLMVGALIVIIIRGRALGTSEATDECSAEVPLFVSF